ncbi:HxlR family transcriptional regulator [Tatumella morbirosei]|uniref:HxlR family transcriptional regulator n=1 Tax=Tatumella morbirosei TaxID=642227 RepID=A0A095T6T6_9GAMM|nr:helix-turn-helix domain-containing protein [Tatumella morbirosei]KGD72591.1 HxlR family transcriptional regulator [Tatumella morbirosei]
MTQNIDLALTEINAARVVLDQIANKWSVLILAVLCSQPARFNQIKKRIDPITHKALTEALRRLERNGLVNRRVIASSPVAVEYSITELGRSLKDPFVALVQWASQYSDNIAIAQQEYAEKNSTGCSNTV